MITANKKSAVKRSLNVLQNVDNAVTAVKTAHSVFHEGHPCTHKNRYSNGDYLFNCKHNRGKTLCTAKLRKKLDGTHATSGTHADSCTMNMDKTTVVSKDVPVPDTSDEIKKKTDEASLNNLSFTPSAVFS